MVYMYKYLVQLPLCAFTPDRNANSFGGFFLNRASLQQRYCQVFETILTKLEEILYVTS